MRLAFFSDSWVPNIDGVVTALVNYRSELEKRGHEVYVFTTGSRQNIDDNDDPYVHHYRAVPFPPYPQYRLALYPFPSKSVVKRENIDVVHSHAIASMGIAAIKTAHDLRLPLVGTYHTMIPYGARLLTKQEWTRQIIESIAWKAIRMFYRPFDLVTAPSDAARKSLVENGVGVPTMVVPNGIDTEWYNPKVSGKAMRRELGLKRGQHMILSTGRLSHEKHVDVLIQAMSLVLQELDAKLVITGGGPAEHSLQALARELNLQDKIVFTGFVPKQKLVEYYAAAEVMATASTFETQGLALLEAMAAGKPAVGARAMAIPEAVKDNKTGFLFEPFHVEDCAEKIVKVLTARKSTYDRWSRNARAMAVRNSIPAATEELLKAYDKVI